MFNLFKKKKKESLEEQFYKPVEEPKESTDLKLEMSSCGCSDTSSDDCGHGSCGCSSGYA
jgi:hypothetical protein